MRDDVRRAPQELRRASEVQELTRALECLGGKRASLSSSSTPLATATLHAPSQAPTVNHPSTAARTVVHCHCATLLLAHPNPRLPHSDAYSACFAPLHPAARSPTFPTTPTTPCLLQPPRTNPSHRQLTCCGRRLHRRRHRHVADWRRASCQAKRLARLTEAQAWTH
jgi:hypothetical protein